MPAWVVATVALDPDPLGSLLENLQLVERLAQIALGADDPYESIHAVLEILLNGVWVLSASIIEGPEGDVGQAASSSSFGTFDATAAEPACAAAW